MKKIIGLLVLVLALAAFAACGNNEQEVEDITLTLWHWDTNMQAQYEVIFEEFYRQTGYRVVQQIVPWADYWTNLASSLEAGEGPDIMWMDHLNAVTYMPSGLLLNLNDFYLDMSGFHRSLYDPFIYNGSLYGVAVFFDTIALFYNKDIFDEAGVPHPPLRGWTWDDFREAAIALTLESGGEVIRYGVSFQTHLQTGTNNFIRQNGGEFINADGSAFNFDTPEALEAIQFWHGLIWEDGVALNPADPAWTNFFLNDLSAMEIHGMWRVAPKYEHLGDRLGIAHLPMRVQEANTVHSTAHAVNANTNHLEIVQQFMEFSTSSDLGNLFAPVLMPAHNDSQRLWFDNFPGLRTLSVFTEALDIARPLPVAAQNAGTVWALIGAELSRVYQLPEITMEDLAEISANTNAVINE